MASNSILDSLLKDSQGLVRDVFEKTLREAYLAGYAKGNEDAVERIMSAAHAQGVARPVVQTATLREVHPNAADARRFPYGAVSKAFRQALAAIGPWGATRDDVIGRVGLILGSDVSKMDHRDTIKRLKKSRELKVENNRYFPGPALGRNENGAQASLLSAPDTREVAASRSDNPMDH